MRTHLQTFIHLLLILGAVVIAAAGSSVALLYRVSFRQQEDRLTETVQSRARLMEAVAEFDAVYSATDVPGGATAATLGQIRQAHEQFQGFGDTGEFTLARREGDEIVFILRQRHSGLAERASVPFDSLLAEPMRRALRGESGTLVGADYRGAQVLAAHEPVDTLDLGVVAKIDLAEIRAPFVRAGAVSIGLGLALVAVAAGLLLRPLVTSLEKSEAALTASRDEAQGYLTVAQTMLVAVDAAGKVSMINDMGCHALGLRREDLIGQAWVEQALPERMHAEEFDSFRQAMDGRRSLVDSRRSPIITAKGEERTVEWHTTLLRDGDGRISGTLRSGQDVTEQLRSQERLRLSEAGYREATEVNERFFGVMEQTTAGATVEDLLDHVYTDFRDVIPYDRIGFALLDQGGDVLRSHWTRSEYPNLEIKQGYKHPVEGSSLQRVIDTGEPRILNDLEAYLREHPDSGSTRLIVKEGVRSSLTCPLVARGRPVGFVFFSSTQPGTYETKHIAAAKQLAGQLALTMEKTQLYRQLVDLNDLKDRFLGTAAHDLRSPLTSILGFLDLILMGVVGEVPEQQEEFLQKVRRSSDGMLRLINDLLDVAAIESGNLDMEMEEADPAALLQECAESAKVLAQTKAIQMKMDLRPGLPRVRMDSQRIEQVITNLITNAIKFSEAETTITVAATSDGKEVRVSVADQGQGIPEDEISQLFRDFTRTSVRPTAGESSTGLGLAIVKRIVEAHHGSVDVTSREGVGSTFTFSLPVGEQED